MVDWLNNLFCDYSWFGHHSLVDHSGSDVDALGSDVRVKGELGLGVVHLGEGTLGLGFGLVEDLLGGNGCG